MTLHRGTLAAALLAAALPVVAGAQSAAAAAAPATIIEKGTMDTLEKELVGKYGEAQRERIRRGLAQTAEFWRKEDGDAAAYADFVRTNFAGDAKALDEMFGRMEWLFESLDGHMTEIVRDFRMHADLDSGPTMPFDETFAGYDPSAHINDDFFENKIAFTVLLNFPVTTLDQRLREGASWSRRQWAEARLGNRFSKRVPASVSLAASKAISEAGQYIASYNIWAHHLLDDKGARLFPPKKRLLTHWNIRDEIKALYGESKTGLPKQRMLQTVMERIVTQTIPATVVDNPWVDWNPIANKVTAAPASARDAEGQPPAEPKISADREPDTRYATLLGVYRAVRQADPYSPTAPTLMDRRFEENREIPEKRVAEMFEQVLSSPLVPRVAAIIRQRLGRPLEPFDIWYSGFKTTGAYTEAQLDEITRKKYPTPQAFAADIPNILEKLGFDRATAERVGRNIIVHPARGSGHAFGAAKRGYPVYLRTRVEKDGMNYKGYNIAVHELGHNVEQTFSLNDIDHTLIAGVPNNAFTEALAFVFQHQDLALLGLATPDAKSRALETLGAFWQTYEIAGVGLVDMAVWRWMYAHPEATPAQLREATIQISKDIWNRYYAPVFGKKDVVLLGIYSHMIDSVLYLPDYPIGHLIAHQVERKIEKTGKIGPEFERMAKAGNIAPDLWMKNATGLPVGPEALLEATAEALKATEVPR
jgi:hypothetical protein